MATETKNRPAAPKFTPPGQTDAPAPPAPQVAAAPETVTEKCGADYPRTVKGKATVGHCGKPKGHPSEGENNGHGRTPYVARAEVAEVPADVLDSYEAVPSDEVVAIKADTAERSDAQKKVDANVKDSHESWVVAGRPKAFNDAPRKRYMMDPDHVAGMTKMLRRAERLHGVRVRIAPVKTHESGKAMLYWVAVDSAPKGQPDESATETATAAPVAPVGS